MQSKAKTMWGHDNGSTHVFVPHHKFVPRSEYMIDTCFENNIAKKEYAAVLNKWAPQVQILLLLITVPPKFVRI